MSISMSMSVLIFFFMNRFPSLRSYWVVARRMEVKRSKYLLKKFGFRLSTYRKVASSRPVYDSILELLGQRSKYISIQFPLHKPSEIWNRDRLLFATLRYLVLGIRILIYFYINQGIVVIFWFLFFEIFQNLINVVSQDCRPWGCRGCHGTPRFWQIS